MNLNKVMLIGRLGRDPETRYTNSGSAVANFSIATTDTWKDKQGQKQERTEWHNIVCWARLADFAQNFLKKGRLIYVEGRLQTRDWTDKENVKHYRTEINANNILFMEPREGGQGAQRAGGGEYEQAPPPAQGPPPPNAAEEESPYMEDDIPF